jgi:NAD+ kinase
MYESPILKPPKTVGIIFNPGNEQAVAMAQELAKALGSDRRCWTLSAGSEDTAGVPLEETDLAITVGGDGTILRAARMVVPYGIPILGVNLGRLGFMTELRGEDALERIPHYLEGGGWLEERAMLQIKSLGKEGSSKSEDGPFHALNDMVLARGALARLIRVGAHVDGAHLTTYRSDAVIVSTATGSTGYNLSAGGPILHPEARGMVLKPVAPHVGLATAVVLPPSTTLELTVESDDPVILSVDGFGDMNLQQGEGVRIQESSNKVLFLREGPPNNFYATLTRRLGFDMGLGIGRAIFY